MVAFSCHTTISGATTNNGTPTIPIMCVFLEKYGNKSNPDKPYLNPVYEFNIVYLQSSTLRSQDPDLDQRMRHLEDQLRNIKAANMDWEKKYM